MNTPYQDQNNELIDRRFEFEEKGFIDPKKPFKWAMLDSDLQLDMFLMDGKYYDHR